MKTQRMFVADRLMNIRSVNSTVFWVVTLYSLVKVYHQFSGASVCDAYTSCCSLQS